MKAASSAGDPWPVLGYEDWRDTATTLQMWTQIAGKVRLALSPWVNHGWQVPLYVNTRGLGTSPIHYRQGMLQIDFDFVDHRLLISTSEGPPRGFDLEPMSVAAFYRRFMAELGAAGVSVTINTMPSEVPTPIRFPDDEVHAAYDRDAVRRFWRALQQVDRVFQLFRTSFLGKSSPVHFFWGSFDLAVTRFSGRKAPLHPGGVPGLPDAITREAYSHEVSSAGFWPGSESYPAAAFYSYAYPMPAGYERASVQPADAVWSNELSEWVLPYDAARQAADPDAAVLSFLQSTYQAAARLGDWDRSLECEIGKPGRPRLVDPTGPA